MEQSVSMLAEAIAMSYQVQLGEKMKPLPDIPASIASKYCGGGHGGYALYLFESAQDRQASGLLEIEPYCR